MGNNYFILIIVFQNNIFLAIQSCRIKYQQGTRAIKKFMKMQCEKAV